MCLLNYFIITALTGQMSSASLLLLSLEFGSLTTAFPSFISKLVETEVQAPHPMHFSLSTFIMFKIKN